MSYMQPTNMRRIRFGLKSLLLFMLVVGVILGLAAQKLRRQQEHRAAIGKMLSHSAKFEFAKEAELQTSPIYHTNRWRVEEKGWRHDLRAPAVLQTVESFYAPTRWPTDIQELEKYVSEMSNLKTLNVGLPPLETIAALSELTKLKTLRVGSASFVQAMQYGSLRSENDTTLTVGTIANLNANPPEPISLTPLTGMTQLSYLLLESCGQTDLTPLAEMTSLETLILLFSGDADLSPLSEMTKLHTLRIVGSPANKLGPLRGLKKLTALDLTATDVADLGPIAELEHLTTLKLSGTQVADLSPLAGLTQLNYITLADTPVSDISALRDVMMLQRLFLSNTNVEDVSALASCLALTELDLSNTKVTDVSPLAHCKALEEVNLSNCPVEDLAPLTGCKMTIVLAKTQRVHIPPDLRRHIWRVGD